MDFFNKLTSDELRQLETEVQAGNPAVIAAMLAQSPVGNQLIPLTDDEHTTRLRCEGSYAAFYREIVWPVIGDVELKWNWHLDCIAEHLEAVHRREIQHLLVNIPPGFSKSITISVGYNAWAWTRDASKRFFSVSYGQNLVSRDCRNTRYVVQSDLYQRLWGHRVQLRSDQNTVLRYDTLAGGWRIGSTTAGQVTGEHPSGAIIIDDPHNVDVRRMDSDDQMAAVAQWYDHAVSTRGRIHNCPHIIVMQRLKHRDLSGHILREKTFGPGQWCHLRLPMRHEKKHVFWSPLGWFDPRDDDGELLWPEAFNEASVQDLERTLGPLQTAGQLQQRPTAQGGTFFKIEMVRIVPQAPAEGRLIRYWDLAGTGGAGAYTAGVLMRLDGHRRIFVEHIARTRLEPGERNAYIKQVSQVDQQRYDGRVMTWVEQEPGSSGKETAIGIVRLLAPAPCRRDPVSGSKEVRASGFAAAAAIGDVFLVEGRWNKAYLDELEAFPRGEYKDQVDASSGAYNKLALAGIPALENFVASGQDPETETGDLSPEEVAELPDTVRAALEGYIYHPDSDSENEELVE